MSAVSLYFAIGRELRDKIRFAAEQRRAAEREQLGLSAIYKAGPNPIEGGGYSYRYELVNVSDVPIDNPAGWLADRDGAPAGERSLGAPAYLVPGERGEVLVAAQSLERELVLHLAWLDPRGQKPDKISRAEVPLA